MAETEVKERWNNKLKANKKNTLLRFEGVYFFALKKILKTFCWA